MSILRFAMNNVKIWVSVGIGVRVEVIKVKDLWGRTSKTRMIST